MAKKILIIEDEGDISELLRVNLEAAGFEVDVAADGESGLRKTASGMPAAVILDIRLPGINGWDVCRRLKADAATCGIPVIFLSASASKENEKKSGELGGAAFVTKPFDPPEFVGLVENIVKGKNTA